MYAVVLSLGAPPFALLASELYPHHLTTGLFMLAWLLSTTVLLALLLLVVRPAGSGGAAQQQGGLHSATVAVTATAASSPLGAVVPPSSPLGRLWQPGASSSRWAWVRQRVGARRQRRNLVLALVASLQCMLWMSLAADELVSLFQVRRGWFGGW